MPWGGLRGKVDEYAQSGRDTGYGEGQNKSTGIRGGQDSPQITWFPGSRLAAMGAARGALGYNGARN
jgi:hypothetical protein